MFLAEIIESRLISLKLDPRRLHKVPLGRVARLHPHRTHDLHSGSEDHHLSKNSVQKTICCNTTSNAPDDGRTYPKHVELKIHK